MSFRLVQISDPHLSAARSYFVANFTAAANLINSIGPDLVVASGDLVLDDPDDDADREFAHLCLSSIEPRLRALPGNHDIGDTAPDPWMGQLVTSERRQRWVDRWGKDWWVEEAEGWGVIGLNSLLFASDLPEEDDQWTWLSDVLDSFRGRPIALMVHKPLCLQDTAETAVSQTAITPEGRRRLGEVLGGAAVRLITSGHIHQYKTAALNGLTMVWAPSVGFVSRPSQPSGHGATKVVGAVEYTFSGRGVSWLLLRAAAMEDIDVNAVADGAPTLRDAPLHPLSASADG